MDSISAALSVLPEERGLIFRTAFGTVPGVRKVTVEGTFISFFVLPFHGAN